MNRCQKKWIFVVVIAVFLFIYIYVSYMNFEGLDINAINLFPTLPANMLPPTPRIKISDSMSQTMPRGVTISTPFPPNKPVGTMGQRA